MTDKKDDIYGSISISPDQPEASPPNKKSSRKQPPPPSRRSEGRQRQTRKTRRPAPEREFRRGGKRVAIWFSLLVLLFGLYSAAGYLLVPYLVQYKLPDYLAARTGASLTTGRISFNPYNFKLVARDISAQTIIENQPNERFLTIDDLRINLDFLSLLRGELTCSELIIQRLRLQIVRYQDKRYNISYLLDNRTPDNQSEIIDFAELPFLFSFNNISISESRVLIDDKISGKEHVIKDIELDLPVISNFPYQTDSYIHPRFSAIINGSPVSLTGEASIGGGGRQTQLSCDINDIDIPLYFDYLPLTLPLDISTGTANGVLHLTFSPQEEQGSRFKVRFNLETTDLGLESRDANMSLSVPEARLEGSLEPFSKVLDFKSILLREPAIVTDQDEDALIGATLASLTPLAVRPPPEHKLHQVIPPIGVKLLIAEGGSFTIRDKRKNETVQSWNGIQLSVKNFSNDQLFTGEEEASFRLSGEHRSTAAFFIWQGVFDDQNHPSGNLQLSSVPAGMLAPFLARQAGDISGTADLRGLFALEASNQDGPPFDYSLKTSTLTIKDLQIKEQGSVWLEAPMMRCDPVSRIKGITDLGNVYLQSSSVTLQRDKIPYLFQVFSARPTQHILHGIDFSGTIAMPGNGKLKPALSLKDVIFQANKLEKQETQKDNFVFSGAIGPDSAIKARGGLHIAPIQINSELSASNLTPAQLFSWFSDSKELVNSSGTISLTGSFLYPQQEFSGKLAAENVQLDAGGTHSFAASTVHLNDFVWSRSRWSLAVESLLVDKPTLTWHREDKETAPVAAASAFLRTYLLPTHAGPNGDAPKSPEKFSVAINQIGISNGMIAYRDERTKPTLAFSLNGINGELLNQGYPAPKESGSMVLNGSIERFPFKLEGTADLLKKQPTADIGFSVAALPLSLISEQVKGRFDNIDTDNVSVDVDYQLRRSNDDSGYQATIRVNNLVPKQSGTNLATAFALISGDGDGSISFDIEGAGAPTRPIIDATLDKFSRIMIKASINPLLLADPAFADLIEQDYITFVPGSDEFTGAALERLNRYGELLSAYPLVNLKIAGRADPESDVEALLEELRTAEQVRVDAENLRREKAWLEEQELERMRLEMLMETEGQIDETDLPIDQPAFQPLLPEPVQVSNTALNELAEQRQQAVIDYLVERLSIDPGRLVQARRENSGIISGADSPRALITLTDGYASLIGKSAPEDVDENP